MDEKVMSSSWIQKSQLRTDPTLDQGFWGLLIVFSSGEQELQRSMRPGRSKELEVSAVAIGKGICLILLTPETG